MAPPTRRSARGSHMPTKSRDTPPQQDSVMIDGTDDTSMSIAASATRGRPPAAANAVNELPVAEASSARNKRGAPDRGHRNGTSDASSRPSKSRKVRFSLPGPSDGEVIDVDRLEDEIAIDKHHDISEDLDLVEEDDHPDIPLCGIKVPLHGNGLLDKSKHSSQNPTVFRPASYKKVSRILKEWFPDEVVANEEEGKAKKRKSPAATIVLEADLVHVTLDLNDPTEGETAQVSSRPTPAAPPRPRAGDDDDWNPPVETTSQKAAEATIRAIAILVHPPSKRAVDGAEQPTEAEPLKEDDLLLLGHIIPSSITASDHPLRYLDEYMIRHELIVLPVCQVSLQEPFFGHKKVNIPPGGRPRDGGYFYRPCPESSNKYRYLDAQLVMEVALPSRSLQYGRASGDDGFVAQKKAGSLKVRNFIASILQCNASKEVFQSHIEVDTEWPTTDFWQREGVNGNTFYLLPDGSPEILPAVLPQSLAAAPEAKSTKDILQLQQRESTRNAGARGGRSSKKRPSAGSTFASGDMQLVNSGEASTSTQEHDPSDQDPDDEKRFLPLAISISSLLRAARPRSTIAEAKLPEATFKAPLYHFQAQAVQWMIGREKNVDVDIGAPMPQWLRIKSREVPSGGESEPSLPQKKVKTEQMTGEPIEADSDSDAGEPEVFRFSLDVVSGTLSRKTFSLGGRRQPGGCLADAMGLGKTLEVLALIVCRPKPGPEEDWVDQSTSAEMIKKKPEQDRPFSTSATLIVAPSALIQQWVVETRRHLGPHIGILEYKSGWKGDEAPAVTMAEMQVRLENVAICFVSYETLVAEYSKSEKAYEFAKPDQDVAISPLLQVHWWRLVADEAQLFASKSTRTTAQTSINSLWRSSSWICSSSPLSSPRDLFSLLTFLDFDIFADPAIFAGLVESAFQRGDAQDVRLLRSLIGKIMIRRERHDTEVARELTLPSQTEQTLICKASGLEAAIWERESGKTKATIDRALGSGRKPPVEAVSTLRALLSHPSVASSLGYGNTDTFAGLLMRQATKLEREMYNRKLEIASLLLAMLTLTQALDKPNNRKLWKTGEPVFHLFELMELLEASQKECEDACKAKVSAEVDMAAIQGDVESTKDDRTYESVNGPSASVPSLGFEEALYWIKVSLGSTTATPPDRIDPERCLNLTFRRRIYKAEQVDTNDARYQPVVRDAGSTEDENWLDNLLGDKMNDPEAREVALRNYTTQGEGAVMVNRLRGQTQGSRAQAKVWAWFPRRKFSPLYTAYTTAKSKAEEAAKGLEWINNRLKEVGISGDTNAGDDELVSDTSSVECIICLEVPILAGVLPCYHSACLDCLEKIAGTGYSTLCPMCRRPFRRDQVSQVLPQQKTGGDGDVSELGVKVNTIAKQVRQRLEKDPTTKVVVFALSRKMLQVVYKGLAFAGLDCAAFAGSFTAQQNALASFRGKTPVMLCPMKQSEGAAGLTLTMANVAIIIEPVLDEALLAQACGRIHRIGQTRRTEILHLVAHNTIEAKIVELRQQRREEARSGATVPEGETLSNQDLAFLFNIDVEDAAKRYNEERVQCQEQRAAEERRVRDLQLQFEARQAARAAQMSSLPRTWQGSGGASSSVPLQAAGPAVAHTTVARPPAASSPQGFAPPQLTTALQPLGPAPQAPALAAAPTTAEATAQQTNGGASSSSMWQRYETFRERVFSAVGVTSNSNTTGGGAGPSRGGGGGAGGQQ